MNMRVQLSLVFDDEDLFNNFVTPYKHEKLLNNLIIKCLGAYYYNEEVRNLIEGTSIDDVSDNDEVKSTQAICDSIRSSLIMQDYLSQELQNIIDTGTEDISEVLGKTNEFAQQSGVAKPAKSEYGSGVLQIEMDKSDIAVGAGIPKETVKDIDEKSAIGLLINAVLKLAETSGNSEVVSMLSPSQGVTKSVETPVVENSSSESASTQVQMTVEKEEEVSTEEIREEPNKSLVPNDIEVEDDFVEEVTLSAENDFSSEEETSVDASDSMNELLSSLF